MRERQAPNSRMAVQKAMFPDEALPLGQLVAGDNVSLERNENDEIVISASLPSSGDSVGVSMGDKFLSGFKSVIKEDEHVIVPAEYEYNGFNLAIDGVLEIEGVVNLFNEDSSENSFDDYYTKIEIDEMIGDIETLLEAL
jgi:hypothetical protein